MIFDTIIPQIKDRTLSADVASVLVESANNSSADKVASAIDDIFSNNGATFANIVTVTSLPASYFSRGYKNLADEIVKVGVKNVTLNADYEKSVQRSIVKNDGGNVEDFKVSKSYTVKDPSYNLTAILCHKDDANRKYLRCHVNSGGSMVYNKVTGKFLSLEDIEQLKTMMTKAGQKTFSKPEPTTKVSDNITHDVDVKNFKLEGVVAIRAKGKTVAL